MMSLPTLLGQQQGYVMEKNSTASEDLAAEDQLYVGKGDILLSSHLVALVHGD